MDNLHTKATNLANNIQDIAQTYYDLACINLAQAGAKAVARATLFFIVTGLVLCIMLLAGIGLSLWVGTLLKNTAAGYFIVAFSYLVLVILLFLLRKQIVFPFIRNFVVRKIYDKTDN